MRLRYLFETHHKRILIYKVHLLAYTKYVLNLVHNCIYSNIVSTWHVSVMKFGWYGMIQFLLHITFISASLLYLFSCSGCCSDHNIPTLICNHFQLAVSSTVLLTGNILVLYLCYSYMYLMQITPYIAQYFPVTFSAVQPYVSDQLVSTVIVLLYFLQLHYISSATSLYFPYDFCLYPGMTALVSYSLRYIPLLLFSMMYFIAWIINRSVCTSVHLCACVSVCVYMYKCVCKTKWSGNQPSNRKFVAYIPSVAILVLLFP